jgi:hypothetical protein
MKRLDFDGLIADAINRYKSSLKVVSFLRFNSKYDKSLKEHIRG